MRVTGAPWGFPFGGEEVLLASVARYVSGVSKDKLHFGVFSGTLQLDALEIKKEVSRGERRWDTAPFSSPSVGGDPDE